MPDYLAILSTKLLERWLETVPSRHHLQSVKSSAASMPWRKSVAYPESLPWYHFLSDMEAALDTPRPTALYQFLGSHNPYHIGHRVMVHSLVTACDISEMAMSIATMGVNVGKLLDLNTYAYRHVGVILSTTLRSMISLPVYSIDLPTGAGLSYVTTWHSQLLAVLAGDYQVRIVMGSDKFSLDTSALANDARLRAKYADIRRAFFVVCRQGDNEESIRDRMNSLPPDHRNRITVLPKVNYSPGPASSSLIRSLRSSPLVSDVQLSDLLAHGELNDAGQVIRRADAPARGLRYIYESQPGTDNYPPPWRYDPQHGCIRFVVSGDDR